MQKKIVLELKTFFIDIFVFFLILTVCDVGTVEVGAARLGTNFIAALVISLGGCFSL